MRILHTSDWHLGKRLMERERLPEQIEALEEIVSICEERNVDVVLVAGDIFDTYLPPAEAEEVFFRYAKKLAGETRAVVVVAGNHDDGVRLSAASPIAADNGIYIFASGKKAFPGGSRPVYAEEAGENFLLLRNAQGESLYINALSYPTEARLRETKSDETYAQKTVRWIEAGDLHYDGKTPHVLLSHLFVAGGKTSESERDIALGGARAIPVSSLPGFGYVALGHLHRAQSVGKNCRYSGSILQYSFDEANTQKSVVLLETKGGDVCVTDVIPLSAGKKLYRLEAASVAEGLALLDRYADGYVELTLRLSAPLATTESEALREKDALVSLVIPSAGGVSAPTVVRSTLGAEELFAEFYRNQRGEEPPAELKTAFLELLEEQ